VNIEPLNNFLKQMESLLKIKIPWNSQKFGCSGLNRNFDDSLKEIKLWYEKPENNDEILVIYLDNDPDFLNWNKQEWLFEPIRRYFGKWVLSQNEKETNYPGRWPTPREMIKDGKRIIFASRENLGPNTKDYAFYPRYWDEGGARAFKPFPTCKGRKPFQVPSRFTDDAGCFGPFFNATGYPGMWHPHVIKEYVDCNLHYASCDIVTPDLMEGFVWTWEKDEPKVSKGCTVLKSNSRWRLEENCNLKLSVACQSNVNHTHWIPSSNVGSFSEGDSLCGAGYKFALPVNPFYNSVLAMNSKGKEIWIKHQE
jgi:hypothetical protein